MTFARRFLWCLLWLLCAAFSLVVAVFADLADNCDAAMCWLEHHQ